MASRNSASLALFFVLNILFFTLTAATDCGCTPSPKPKPVHGIVPPKPVPSPSVPSPSVPSPSVPSPSVPSPSTPGSSGICPIDALRLGVCANVLSGLLNVQLGQPSSQSCCSVIQGLADLEAAVCLCTALRANVLGINLNVPISLSILLNVCNKSLPSRFQCR
ncbi:unnamed protein product [Microthlaspi erraticum]|uniref:Bifunctional inhibitor/plant lipid transfer protein/seed storage helical domain-containing protein n=1 Tax=Microthlaspi erraticum TaxID=1685480 RepID=A0A6D2KMA8_9BRAS|nr:unnamed protein product [Microthlaspi erraticum]